MSEMPEADQQLYEELRALGNKYSKNLIALCYPRVPGADITTDFAKSHITIIDPKVGLAAAPEMCDRVALHLIRAAEVWRGQRFEVTHIREDLG